MFSHHGTQVNMSRTGGGGEDTGWQASVRALRYLMASPMWGAT